MPTIRTRGDRERSATPSLNSSAPPTPTTYESFADIVASSPGPLPARERKISGSLFGSTSSRRTQRKGYGSTTSGGPERHSWLRTSATTQTQREAQKGLGIDEQEEEQQGGWLKTRQLVLLTVGLAGAQLAWTVEMAYGTPYLLSLGLSKEATSLTWLAGPLAGLIVQPLIGAFSDASTGRYRRRGYIVVSAAMVLGSTLVVAFAKELGGVLAFFAGKGSWDPSHADFVHTATVALAVAGFYLLDFALNGLQATLRALVLDRVQPRQAGEANAWLGRMTHIGNIVGYSAGYLDLGHAPGLSWVGGGQFRKLAVLACVVMGAAVTATCMTQKEGRKEVPLGEERESRGLWRALVKIKKGIKDLPEPVKRVCYVQFFNSSAWFPFLFYSTTYVSEIIASTTLPAVPLPPGGSQDANTRSGSLALLLYALVAMTSGVFLPLLTALGDRPSIQLQVRALSGRRGRLARKTLAWLSPRNLWSVSLGLIAFLTVFCTFFVRGKAGAMAIIVAMGVPWGINSWVPYALVMEAIREEEVPATPDSAVTPNADGTNSPMFRDSVDPLESPSPSPSLHAPSPHLQPTPTRPRSRQRTVSANGEEPLSPAMSSQFSISAIPQPFRASQSRSGTLMDYQFNYSGRAQVAQAVDECAPLMGTEAAVEAVEKSGKGATTLGIHNLAIVLPQFVVSLVAMIIFRLLRTTSEPLPGPEALAFAPPPLGTARSDVVWVLRYGGLCALAGVWVSRGVIAPRSELEYRETVKGLRGIDDLLEAGSTVGGDNE